jgi:Cu(I)/Ag(I) efflux system protein CusF
MKIVRTAVLATLLGSSAALAQQAMPQVAATVTKVDKAADRITLQHGPIPNLDMGEMTMVFRAGDKAMLDQVKPGDHVLFSADRVNGQITIVKIELAPAGSGGTPAN